MPLTLKTRTSPARVAFTFSPASPSPPPDAESEHDPPRPPADLIPERDMHMFGALPILGAGELGRGLLKCTRCARIVMESAGAEHKRICAHVLDGAPLTTKKTTKADKSSKTRPESTKKRRASDLSQETEPSPSKKRTRVTDTPLVNYKGLKKSEVKRLLKEKARSEKRAAKERERMEVAERKRLRATGPVNYDRQCGVINDKKLPCSRSLTCKTHTVGAKRAVEGRSRPYDELYLEWQRANNPNFKEPAQKAKKPAGAGGAGEGGTGSQPAGATKKRKKEWEDKIGGDDDSADGGWEELLHLTRMAADKVQGVRCGSGAFGMGMGTSNGLGTGMGTGMGMGMGMGMGIGSGKKGPSGASIGGGMGAGSSAAPSSVWRLSGAAQLEFAAVGDLMAKALAARAVPVSTTQSTVTMPPGTLKAGGAGGGGGGVGAGGTGVGGGVGGTGVGGGASRTVQLPPPGQQVPLSMASGPGAFASSNLGMGQPLFSVTA